MVDNHAIQKLDSDSRCIQGQLEGLYRQLYQGCTQQMLTANHRMYSAMMDQTRELFESLTAIMEDYNSLMRTEHQEDKTLN